MNLLLWILIVPSAAGCVALLLPRSARGSEAAIGIVGSVTTFLLSLPLLGGAAGWDAFRRIVEVPWLSAPWPISLRLGVDGVSATMVVLTTLVSALVVIAAAGRTVRSDGESGRKGLIGLLMLLEGCTLGLFLSLDLVFFYFFWDLMLIPSYLLLSGWGGAGGRAAGMKYILYNGIGGLALLFGVVAIGLFTGSFDLPALTGAGLDAALAGTVGSGAGATASQALLGGGLLWTDWTTWAFVGLAVGFLVKVPLFPFHGWMPATYEHAPFPVAAFLSAVQSKAGLYGLLRVALPLFPFTARAFAPIVIGLALAGVVYGALIALSRRGALGVVAYSSLSHLGLIVVAIFAFQIAASQGAVLQMANHGVFTAALFLLLAAIEARTGTLDLERLGGLSAKTPVLGATFLIASLGALGMPGLNGFAGEFLMLVGISHVSGWYVGIGLFAVVVAAAYMLRLFQSVMHGVPAQSRKRSEGDLSAVRDLSWREAVAVVPLTLLVIWLGMRPAPIPERVGPSPSVVAATSSLQLASDVGAAPFTSDTSDTSDGAAARGLAESRAGDNAPGDALGGTSNGPRDETNSARDESNE